MKLVVIDTSISNIYSLESALNFVGVRPNISVNHEEILGASHLILPGIGNFDKAIKKLKKNNLDKIIYEFAINHKKPVLGICLGMQLLFQKSNEGTLNGLSIIKGEFKKLIFENKNEFKVPNVGFHRIKIKKNTGIFSDLENNFFYFTHSFGLFETKNLINYSLSKHTEDFVSAFQNNNVCGTQFHPEKSQSSGIKLLNNFLRLRS